MKTFAFILLTVIGIVACVAIYLSQHEIDCERFIASPDEAFTLGKHYILEYNHVHEKHGYKNAGDYIADIEKNPNCCSAYYGNLGVAEYYHDKGWIVSINATKTATKYEHIIEFSPCFGPPMYNGGLSGQ